MIKSVENTSRLDNWGMAISLLCCIHCALMPILFISSTYFSSRYESLHLLELPLLALSIVIGITAIIKAYKSHKKYLPSIVVLSGIALLLLGGLVKEDIQETVIRVSGSITVIIGHLLNKRSQNKTTYEN